MFGSTASSYFDTTLFCGVLGFFFPTSSLAQSSKGCCLGYHDRLIFRKGKEQRGEGKQNVKQIILAAVCAEPRDD